MSSVIIFSSTTLASWIYRLCAIVFTIKWILTFILIIIICFIVLVWGGFGGLFIKKRCQEF